MSWPTKTFFSLGDRLANIQQTNRAYLGRVPTGRSKHRAMLPTDSASPLKLASKRVRADGKLGNGRWLGA
jgi:hypothetical protein